MNTSLPAETSKKYGFRIVVHPSRTRDANKAGYWTEVVEMPTAMAVESTEIAVVAQTRLNIREALLANGMNLRDEEQITVQVDYAI